MQYEYSGYLKALLDAPDHTASQSADAMEIAMDDLARWPLSDFASEEEWRGVPAHARRTEDGVAISGNFTGESRIDIMAADIPRFWAPLRSPSGEESPFPVDLNRYPVLEVTYRCTSDAASPGLAWTYPGGSASDWLRASRQWTTCSRLLQTESFPESLDSLVLRVYSERRSEESMEIKTIRFRAMTPAEVEACAEHAAALDAQKLPKRYPVLDEFLPLGVVMNAETAKRHAENLAIPMVDYWTLVLHDLVSHHHNCIALEFADRLTPEEFDEMCGLAEPLGIKVVAFLDLLQYEDPDRLEEAVKARVAPFADSDVVLGWGLATDAKEHTFKRMIAAQAAIARCDSKHPAVVATVQPGSFPRFAARFPVMAIAQFSSHQPWEFGELVQKHRDLSRGQQFWMVAPTFVRATNAPAWNSPPELRLMINLAIANGARGWFSHTYHNDPAWMTGSKLRSLTGPFLMFSELWLELDKRMARLMALAPLLLGSKPEPLPDPFYVRGDISEDYGQIAEGLLPTTSYRLAGKDYSLYFVVSNDIRGMPRLDIQIPNDVAEGLDITDLTDFFNDRVWRPMKLERHIEMFPGQARIILISEPEASPRLRADIARRLVEDDRAQLAVNLRLARTYGLDTSAVEAMIANVGDGDPLKHLSVMDEASDALMNQIYATPHLCTARSWLIEASSAICGCDGALCHLIGMGKADLARSWGVKVVPMAREVTNLRLQFHAGHAEKIGEQCADVVSRSLALLADIRSEYTNIR